MFSRFVAPDALHTYGLAFTMPELTTPGVLQRSQELIAVGQASAALTILHEHVNSKRSRNSPISSLEPVMLQFVELCVDLKKGKLAKDGLYQYKNTAQNTNVGTIEVSDLTSPLDSRPL